jgi:hypothetical protein
MTGRFDGRSMLKLVPARHGLLVFGDGISDSLSGPSGDAQLPPWPAADSVQEPPLQTYRPFTTDDLGGWVKLHKAAATHLGPTDGQWRHDKLENQDFALAAKLDGRRPMVIGIVSDGVTNDTFFPARAARIAAITAYQVVCDIWQMCSDAFDKACAEKIRVKLSYKLGEAFARDHQAVLASGAIPRQWKPDIFNRHKDKSELWYNATLLVVILGEDGGFAIHAGDGGIIALYGPGSELPILRSTASSTITTFVGNRLSPEDQVRHFTVERIPATNVSGAPLTAVALSSDGVDRTLQYTPGAEDTPGAFISSFIDGVDSSGPLDVFLNKLATGREKVESDNLSLVFLRQLRPSR